MIDVLVYEPDERNRKIIERACKNTEFALSLAHSAEEVKAVTRKTPPELVVFNFFLPDIMGLDLCETIKFSDRNTISGVVLLVTTNEWRDLLKMYQSGASDTIKTPFSKADILETLRTVQKRKNVLQKREILGNWIHYNLSSSLSMLNSVNEFLTDLLHNTPLDSEAIQSMGFALNEFLLNSIEHGNQFDLKKNLDIHYVLFHDKLVIKITDEGEGFTPDKVPNPMQNPKSVAEEREEIGKRPGGYGIAVSKMYVDDLFYSDKGNTLILSKNFVTPGTPSAQHQSE